MNSEILRSIKRLFKKGSSGMVKILLLAVSLTVSLILISKIYFESSYESFVPELDSTYRISSLFGGEGETLSPFDNTPGGIAPEFQRYSGSVDFTTRILFVRYSSSVKLVESSRGGGDEMVSSGRIIAADSTIFDIFDVERVGSDPKKVLVESGKDNVFISYSLAQKLTKEPNINSLIGKRFATEDNNTYTIVGLYKDFPSKSYMKEVDIIRSISIMSWGLDNLDGNERYSSFVRFKKGADIDIAKDDITRMSKELIERLDNKAHYTLTPLAEFHRAKPEVRNSITTLSTLAIAILLVAIMNYILISISSLVDRSKEIALYKCYGASNGVIYRMLLSDAAISILLSLLLSTSLVMLFRVGIEGIVGSNLAAIFDTDALPILVATTIFTLLVCGIIPAYIYSKVPLSTAFRRPIEQRRGWKHALLTIQFGGTTFFIALLAVAAMQYKYLLNLDVGYSYKNIVTVTVAELEDHERELLRKELLQNPKIEKLSYSYSTPINYGSGNVILTEEGEQMIFVRDQFVADSEFVEVYDIEIVDGRNFDPLSPQGREVLVSQSFVEQMSQHKDWSDGAIQKEFNISGHNSASDIYTICGVYKDYLIGSGANIDNRPTLLFFNDTEEGFWHDYFTKLSLKIAGEVTPEIISEINKKVADLFPKYKIFVEGYSAQVENLYSENKKMRDLVLVCTLIVLIITLIGVIGYTRNEIAHKRSEIAIRKIHGATTWQIILIFVREIRFTLMIGLVAGSIATYFGSNLLLETIANKVTVTPWIFVWSSVSVVLVIVTVIVATTHKAANGNPTENIKS